MRLLCKGGGDDNHRFIVTLWWEEKAREMYRVAESKIVTQKEARNFICEKCFLALDIDEVRQIRHTMDKEEENLNDD